jgi:hypothetical protein
MRETTMNKQPGSTASVDEAQLADQIELTADISVNGETSLEIRYQVTNRSAEPIVLLNYVRQPGSEPEQDPDRVFVEPQADGTVVITQRALVEKVPSSKRPQHRAVLVEPGDSFMSDFSLSLPLQYANPEAPKAVKDVANPPERAQLCLGYVPAARFDDVVLAKIRDGEEVRPISPTLPPDQSLLCSEVQQLG